MAINYQRWLAAVIVIILFYSGFSRLVVDSRPSRKLRKAVNIVLTELRFARHYARQNKCYTAVMMPNIADLDINDPTAPVYGSKSFRAVTVSGQPRFDGIRKIFVGNFGFYINKERWKFLPEDVYIGDTPSHGKFGRNHHDTYCNVLDNVRFPEAESPKMKSSIRAIFFAPSGNIIAAPRNSDRSTGDIQIKIMLGFVKEINSLWQLADNTGSYSIAINQFNGDINVKHKPEITQ